ncbi:MAG: patatin-like phospholipase family protein, partial [Pseudomonadota bacterium]
MRHFFVTACLIAVLLPLGACTTVLVRFPVPQDQLDEAMPYGIDAPFIRYYADELSEELEAAIVSSRFAEQEAGALPFAPEIDSIAFSGGGPDGAFGAGLMSGWTKRGDRPSFRLASGVSTGAIIALYAFLGPEYDDELTEIYTSYETDDLVTPTIFAGLTGGTALTSTRGYRALIEDYISPAVVDELEAAHEDGRFLFIGTTNIDASRPV